MFGVPYIMSAFCSPLLGLLIDRFGKRAFITCVSSLILVSGFAMSMMMPECLRCYNEMIVGRIIFGMGGESMGVA